MLHPACAPIAAACMGSTAGMAGKLQRGCRSSDRMGRGCRKRRPVAYDADGCWFLLVMPALVAGIHAFKVVWHQIRGLPGQAPAITDTGRHRTNKLYMSPKS